MERWNHNLHYHRLILRATPERCRCALDIGCGEGILTRELRALSEHVVGIDLHEPSIERAPPGGEGVEYVRGDVLRHSFAPASFDFLTSVAALHHMDTAAGLARMAELVKPGGTIALLGLARSRSPLDHAWDLAGAVAHQMHQHVLGKGYWEHDAPTVWPPPDSYAQVRDTARQVLSGARYRRHALWRYSLIWHRPDQDALRRGGC